MDRYSVIFCGTPEFACPSLQALYDDPAFEVLHVITQPDKPVGRKQVITPPPVKLLAEELNIPVLQPENINGMQAPENPPDFLVVVAYGQILKPNVFAIPKIAPINVHASLLPRFRGASPIQHSILAGDTETGVTVQRMAEKLDTGPILSQQKVPIDPRETSVSLTESLSQIGAQLLVETLKKPLTETVQDESKATLCKKLTRQTGEVDQKTMTAEDIDRKVRALVPWPGVKSLIDGKEAKIIETSLEEDDNALAVPCAGSTTLHVLKLQAPGKKVVGGKEWSS